MTKPKIHPDFPNYKLYPCGKVQNATTGKFLKLPTKLTGKAPYPQIGLSKDGRRYTKDLHRFFAETFVTKPKHPEVTWKVWRSLPLNVRKLLQKDMQVDHIRRDIWNWKPSNLRWTTGEQNRGYYHAGQK